MIVDRGQLPCEQEHGTDASGVMPTPWKELDYEDLEFGERIGGGGVGVVYAANLRGRKVAVKTLFDPRVDDSLRKEFLDELLVVSKLKHKNVVDFLGASLKTPHLFFIMEYCPGSVFDLLHGSGKKVSLTDRLKMAMDTAEAMAYLHSQNPPIVHRDLKSQNLLLSMTGSIKLCDFGLVSSRVVAAGTPNYMPPELLASKTFSKKVDVYMFGILLWELAAREIPFCGYDASEIKAKVVRGERPNLNSVEGSDKLKALISLCWSQDPNARPDFPDIIRQLASIQTSPERCSEVDMLDNAWGDALDSLVK